jgi:hypothetical protein
MLTLIEPSVVESAADLRAWFMALDLPTRTINALQRDLDVVIGQREGKAGSGVLAHMDREMFRAELYRANGGKIRSIPGIADTSIAALRANITPPDDVPNPLSEDFTLPPLDDDDLMALNDADPAPIVAEAPRMSAPERRVPRRRGRPPLQRTATPPVHHVLPEPDLPPVSPLIVQPVPTPVLSEVNLEDDRILQLWAALHPQGRRAALGFMATLVLEEAT